MSIATLLILSPFFLMEADAEEEEIAFPETLLGYTWTDAQGIEILNFDEVMTSFGMIPYGYLRVHYGPSGAEGQSRYLEIFDFGSSQSSCSSIKNFYGKATQDPKNCEFNETVSVWLGKTEYQNLPDQTIVSYSVMWVNGNYVIHFVAPTMDEINRGLKDSDLWGNDPEDIDYFTSEDFLLSKGAEAGGDEDGDPTSIIIISVVSGIILVVLILVIVVVILYINKKRQKREIEHRYDNLEEELTNELFVPKEPP
ncbi:MAG: hypothetical protein ACMUHY_07915 [Thermoplasmatota archaeon]